MKAESLYELLQGRFAELIKKPDGRDFLVLYNQTIEFNLTDSDPFVVDIRDGKVTTRKGVLSWPPGTWDEWSQATKLTGDEKTFVEVVEGRLRFADAVVPDFNQSARIQVSSIIAKWSVSSWICRLMQRLAALPET